MAIDFSRIALQPQKHERVQTVMHYVNKETLKEEHKRQKYGKATGIDKVSKEEYALELDENLDNLVARMKTFSYRPQAVRRTYIPKTGSDKMRPLGIPAYEDRLVQGVMRKVLDQIYEQKFYDFSYGFRKGRSCHQAVRVINQTVMTKKVNWVHLPSDFTSRRTPLVFGCILPAAGRIWDFHPLETCAVGRTKNKAVHF